MSARATTSIDLVASSDDLASEVGGTEALDNLAKDGNAEIIRAALVSALDDVVYELRNRVPPIAEAALQDVTELRIPVMYGALARLYHQNATTGAEDDIHSKKARDYRRMYDDAVDALRPTVLSGEKAAPAAIALHRR